VQVEPLCDVCNGKMSLETFVNFKISKETGAKKTDKRSRSRYDTQPTCTQSVDPKLFSSGSESDLGKVPGSNPDPVII
jgi:hypothetical protein